MKIPIFPLDLVLFPGAALPLHIFEDRYKEMIGECLQCQGEFGMVRARREGLGHHRMHCENSHRDASAIRMDVSTFSAAASAALKLNRWSRDEVFSKRK